MNQRDIRIAEAARRVFSRHGVGKTTMNDIAREAGVARQTLYNAYSNKDDVLRATVRHACKQTKEIIEEAWANEHTFGRILDHYFVHMPLRSFDIVKLLPNAAPLMDGTHFAAREELELAETYWRGRFATLLQKHSVPGSLVHREAGDMADYICSTAAHAKYNAPDRDVLVARLDMLKASVLALSEQPA